MSANPGVNTDPTRDFRRLDRQDSNSGTLYEEGFLNAEECELLITCFERNSQGLRASTDKNSTFFDNRFLWFTSLPPAERAAKALMQSARHGIISRLKRAFGVPQLYSDTIQLVKWSRGQPMPAHADNAFPDGKDHPTFFRNFAAIVYLNADFTGGELYYANQKLLVVPKPGLMVGFPGGMSHMHGVRGVERGVRYTMPSWYTCDATRKDRSEDEDYGPLPPR